jgi:hypothetical protein
MVVIRSSREPIVDPGTDNTTEPGSAPAVLITVTGVLSGTFGGALTRGFQR